MKHLGILILILFFYMSCKSMEYKQNELAANQNMNLFQESQKNEIQLKNELYKSICALNNIYLATNKEIYFSFWQSSFAWYVNENGKRKSKVINDSLRISVIDEGIDNEKFRSLFTSDFYNRIISFKNSLNDPVNIGYLITKHEMGKTLLNILSDRNNLNFFEYGVTEDDPSALMSEQDYINYHKEKINIVNDSLAVYKNRDAEISLEENYDVCYFIFKKENQRWLLDDIVICKSGEEEQYDLKLIGESKPLKYYKAESYDYEE